MAGARQGKGFQIAMNDRNVSVAVFSLFFSWQLAFPFQGQILYAISSVYGLLPQRMFFGAIAACFAGLFLCGFIVKTMRDAKRLMLCSIVFCLLTSSAFFFPPSHLWTIAIVTSSFLAGGCVASWGFFLKHGTPKSQRIKTVADGLIYSNILMIALNMAAIHIAPFFGLGLSMMLLCAAFLFALRLPAGDKAEKTDKTVSDGSRAGSENPVSIVRPLAFLCLFIIVITINSGLMYQVLNPAYAHLEWLTSWYWAIPYIVALYIMRNLPRSTNRTYILYVAIAMIGFSFIFFMILDRSATGYLVVNTLMLGACGVYDLFWWSILGEMLEFDQNAAKVLGVGISANVLGVLLGGLAGNAATVADEQGVNSSLLALGVVCLTLILLPVLHKHLSSLLKDHAYLTVLSELSAEDQDKAVGRFVSFGQLTEREKEIAVLLLKGKTYRMIAGELSLSENTIKTHVKNIYAKYKIQSRTELINLVMEGRSPNEM
jgi:DNA-binding CsgD family transcriptional regulator/MFS family permease